jgi:hypothetical protein
MFLYVTVMVSLTRYSSGSSGVATPNTNNNDNKAPQGLVTRDQWGDRNPPYKAKPDWGHGVEPQLLVPNARNNAPPNPQQKQPPPQRVLTAYVEPIDQSTWSQQPLPVRTWTAEDLKKSSFPQLNTCSKLPEQWPVDDVFPSRDPFLPWIHDVFPTQDGKHIQFVAQNKRRCKTGTTAEEFEILRHMAPQVALFQHVAIQRLNKTTTDTDASTRYRLASHEEADEDGMVTRFICRFQPSGQETLSVFNVNYEWASFRKMQKKMFHEEGRDNKQIHTSQLMFQCPVPKNLIQVVQTGASVVNDYATLFVDLIPIRTPPRYGPPNAFLPPHYEEFRLPLLSQDRFDPSLEWGEHHVLPKIENSGRWENIPICKPTLLTYGKQTDDLAALPIEDKPVKQHRLASCLWASTGYTTRGNRFAINDGQRRLLEWITYNKLIGVEHFYLYDNSGAFSQGDDPNNSLQPIADLFPADVTLIRWPSKVCNNNPNNVDSVGERSSQYAAEASCRLRFGPHVEWIAQFDIDEYLVPMGNLTTIHPLLDSLDREGNKIVSFGSWRAWPRRRFIE